MKKNTRKRTKSDAKKWATSYDENNPVELEIVSDNQLISSNCSNNANAVSASQASDSVSASAEEQNTNSVTALEVANSINNPQVFEFIMGHPEAYADQQAVPDALPEEDARPSVLSMLCCASCFHSLRARFKEPHNELHTRPKPIVYHVQDRTSALSTGSNAFYSLFDVGESNPVFECDDEMARSVITDSQSVSIAPQVVNEKTCKTT